MYNNPDINSYINVKFKTGESPANGYAFVLSSISSKGDTGKLNGYIVNELGLSEEPLPDTIELSNGFKLMDYYGRVKILYIVTVDGNPVGETYRKNLRAAFRYHVKDLNWPMWAPLLGTGAGELSYGESFLILAEELERNENLHGRGIDLTVSLPNDLKPKEWKTILDYSNQSSFLNLRKSSYSEVDLEKVYFKSITEEREFYFSKAVELIEKLKPYGLQAQLVKYLQRKETGESPVRELYELWNELEQPSSAEFLMMLDEDRPDLVEAFEEISTLIAYLDRNAWKGDELNEYSPKRYVARTMLRQSQLLKYVMEWILFDFDIDETARKETIFHKAISFLTDPLNHVSIVSEKHRIWISEHYLKSSYNYDSFEDELFKYFNFLRDKVTNPSNFSFLISALLYHRDFRWQWDEGMGVVGGSSEMDESLGETKSQELGEMGANRDEETVDIEVKPQIDEAELLVSSPSIGDSKIEKPSEDVEKESEGEEMEESEAPDVQETLKKVKNLNQELEHLLDQNESEKKGSDKLDPEVKAAEMINNPLQLTRLNSDSAHQGQDLLGFKQDIEAFASIVNLRELTPPLAIALFGQWGTGKSFFMQKLSEKIKELAETQGFLKEQETSEQGSADQAKEKPFCEGVCQIHFNAWSYMDTNLWASLVTQIFEGLEEYITKDNKAKKEKTKIEKRLSKKLQLSKEQEKELSALKEEKELEYELLKSEKRKRSQYQSNAVKAVRDASIEEVIGKLKRELQESGTVTALKESLSKLDIDTDKIAQWSPQNILNELNAWKTFGLEFLKMDKKQWWKLGGLALLILVLALVPGLVRPEWNFQGLSFLGITGSALVAMWEKARTTLAKINPVIEQVTAFKNQYEERKAQLLSEQTQRIAALRLRMEQNRQEITRVERQLQGVEQEIHDLEYSLKHTLSQKALYSFILERSQSSDYEQHLGIISTIRRDFETLSFLFIESLKELEALEEKRESGELDEKEMQRVESRIKSLLEYREISEDFDKPLERIILYIDDLDRCPEERVVEVLEAVNLLMAFPLFIVIVGVDPRWVKNALIKKYRLQFTGQVDGTELAKSFGMEVINPSDYLEKIFQVPFHLMSPSNESIQGMIEHLVKDSVMTEEELKKREEELRKKEEAQAEQEAAEMEAAEEIAEAVEAAEEEQEEERAEEAEMEEEASAESHEAPQTANESGIRATAFDDDTPEAAQEEEKTFDFEQEMAEEAESDDFSGAVPETAEEAEAMPDMAAEAQQILDETAEEESSDPGQSQPALVRVTPDSLKLHPAELQYMKDFSWLIGNTPRTVKRFVNMYRIIRAHEGLSYQDDEDRIDLLVVMFLLALRIGAYSSAFWEVIGVIHISHSGLTIEELIDVEFKHQALLIEQELDKQGIQDDKERSRVSDKEMGAYYRSDVGHVLNKLAYNKNFEKLRASKGSVLDLKVEFVKRFSFKSR